MTNVLYRSTKTFEHVVSVAFRQWRADSHCDQLHGYALTVKLTFGATRLTKEGWVIDFGGLKPFKSWLEETFDHKTVVALDDPNINVIKDLKHNSSTGPIATVEVLPNVGCEAFAKQIFDWLDQNKLVTSLNPHAFIHSVEVSEHTGNSALVIRNLWS